MGEGIVFQPVYLPVNQGHGNARRASLAHCSHNLVALMDADDLALPNRFEKQLEAFVADGGLSIVGGQITEFIGSPSNIIGKRVVPENDADIKTYMKKRCPMNQVAVMFKKDFAEQVGGYQDWYCEEDYYLWLRMALAGGKFANVADTLVNVRVGDAMSARRGGWKYFRSEARLQAYMLKKRVISLPRYLYNTVLRFGGEVLLTDKLRTRLFQVIRGRDEPPEPAGEPAAPVPKKEGSEYPPFSVAMCVYGGDNAEWFDSALDSVVRQTVKPDEIVLVVDGPIPYEIQNVIDKYAGICRKPTCKGVLKGG